MTSNVYAITIYICTFNNTNLESVIVTSQSFIRIAPIVINTINTQIRALYKKDFLAGSGITEHVQNAVAPPTKRVSKDMQPKKIGANKFKNFMK